MTPARQRLIDYLDERKTLHPTFVETIKELAAEIEASRPPDAGEGLDVEDWENIEEALGTAASYPQEMEVNRERWLATREKVRAALAAHQSEPPANRSSVPSDDGDEPAP